MSDEIPEAGSTETSVTILQARCDQLERELVDMKQKAEKGMIMTHLQVEATRAGMIDLDGLKLLDLSQVAMTETGQIQGVVGLMGKFRKDKPWLFGKPSTSMPGSAPPSQPPRQKRATDMTETEYQAARAAILRHR